MATAAHPPGPKGKLLVGHLLDFRRDHLSFLTNVAREYGDIVHFKLGPQDVFLLNQPDYIKDVLVTNHKNFIKSRGLERAKLFLGEGLLTSEGEFHKRQRRLSQPAFHRQRIASYGATMVEYATRLRDHWTEGATVEMAHEMMRLTLGIAGKTLFDADVESDTEDVGEAMAVLQATFDRVTLPFAELLDKLPLPSNRRFERARQQLDAIVFRLINERRASGRDHGDLLSMLMLAQDEEGDGGSMTDQQLRDELMTIFLAGHETTANALTWTWYLLSQHPTIEAKLQAELDRVLGGRLPTVDDLPQLRYVEMILAEAMRLYPPAWTVGRRAVKDYEIGGYFIPAGSIILLSQYVTQRDPRFFPDPERFDPERWTPAAQETRPKFSYFPFGGGPRVCIGEGFAWMEGVLVIATLAQQWQPRLVPGHPVALQAIITLRPKHGMRMTLHRLPQKD